ncbi:MAG: methyl-accepting chemotaxis protein [Gammaproteobacteria bacterium]|nr:methyl-accepting chemotaxis protein [Gammaproteobacteria bacterium]MBU2056647.1 methyl-accepting chemotaxis protein [Gammaproteobacteria bacterium]MBU2173984.1 methyl-accepting chemotaxis protein [Gammaproteobacteria bacterium]MBU2247290.1 methyl-accepting chemotaxis protein [Gammaproteobacteria bacterium]MBU2344948.1 methyl-accepting chemotaxis protein [Gammaproteobacteria bacterium]
MFRSFSLLKKIWVIISVAIFAFLVVLASTIYFRAVSSESIILIKDKMYDRSKFASQIVVEFNAIEEFFTQAVSLSDPDILTTAKITEERVLINLGKLKQLDTVHLNQLEALQKDFRMYSKVAAQIAESMIEGSLDMSTAQNVIQDKTTLYETAKRGFIAYEKQTDDSFQEILMDMSVSSERSVLIIAFCGTILLIIMAVLGHMIGSNISKTANNLANSLHVLASGKGSLSSRLSIDSEDEFGAVARNFNEFISLLQHSFFAIAQLVDPVIHTADALTKGMQELDSMTNQQKNDADTVSHSMEEMQFSVQDISLSANAASGSANDASRLAKLGYEQTTSSVKASQDLACEISHVSLVITTLAEQTQEVGGILKSINDIAGQTNLLALNAAIEAARAGDQGRGFAVVADEVRLLSSRTASSVTIIHDLLAKLTQNVENAVHLMQNAVVKANNSAVMAAEAGSSIELINQEINNINMVNTQIATATEEQTMVASLVLNNTHQMATSFTQTIQLQRSVADISDQLRNLSYELNEVSAKFR